MKNTKFDILASIVTIFGLILTVMSYVFPEKRTTETAIGIIILIIGIAMLIKTYKMRKSK